MVPVPVPHLTHASWHPHWHIHTPTCTPCQMTAAWGDEHDAFKEFAKRVGESAADTLVASFAMTKYNYEKEAAVIGVRRCWCAHMRTHVCVWGGGGSKGIQPGSADATQ